MRYFGAKIFTKQNAALKQINSYLYCLIVGLKRQNLHQAPKTGPRRALIAPKSLLVGQVTQSDWIDILTIFILIIFKCLGNSKLNDLSFDQNHLIKNPILFCKYFGPLILDRSGFVFKICVWISVFRRKKQFENPMLGCQEICKINTAPFFLKHPVASHKLDSQKSLFFTKLSLMPV